MKTAFEFKSYKAILTNFLTGKKNRGQLTLAAERIGCQRSYLSRVISENLHLTPDHAFGIARFLKLKKDERQYFLKLVEWERSSEPQYRQHLALELSAMATAYDSIGGRTQRSALGKDEHDKVYFSSWLWSAVHFLTAIPTYQNVKRISERLNAPEVMVLKILEKLEARGLVENCDGNWIYAKGEFHLNKNSSSLISHHQNWRQRSVLDAQNEDSEGVHFTAVQAISHEIAEVLRIKLLDFIAEFSAVADPSEPEETYALTLDLFKV